MAHAPEDLSISAPSQVELPLLTMATPTLLYNGYTHVIMAAPTALSLHPPHHGYTHLIMKSGANYQSLIIHY